MDELTVLAYIQDELSATEKAAFEAAMQNDASLANQVKEMQSTHHALLDYGLAKRFAEQVKNDFTPSSSKKEPYSFFRIIPLPLAIAASVVLLIGFAWWWRSIPNANWQPDAIWGSTTASHQGVDNYIGLSKAYKNKDWAYFEAHSAEITPEMGAKYDTVQIMAADVAMFQQKWQDGIVFAEKLTTNPNTNIQAQGYHRLAYNYYQLHQIDRAKEALAKWEVLQPNHPKLLIAKKVLK